MIRETTANTPSNRYAGLLRHYREMHATSETVFAGHSLRHHLKTIRRLVRQHGARTLLDYGAGRGVLYTLRDTTLPDIGHISSVVDYLGVNSVACYDPGVPSFSYLPPGKFDGVISTDVLEHIAEDDIPWILDEMFGKANRFVFANIASYPAKTKLPSGENAHVTQREPKWWRERLKATSARNPGVAYLFQVKQKQRFLPHIFGRHRATLLASP